MKENDTKNKSIRNPYLIEFIVFPSVTIIFLILFLADRLNGENGWPHLFFVFVFGALSFEFFQKYRSFKSYSMQFPKDVYDESSLVKFMKEDTERMTTSQARRKAYERSIKKDNYQK